MPGNSQIHVNNIIYAMVYGIMSDTSYTYRIYEKLVIIREHIHKNIHNSTENAK